MQLSERIVAHGRKLGMQLGVGINTVSGVVRPLILKNEPH